MRTATITGYGVPIFEKIIARLPFDQPMINHKISSSSNNLKHAYSSYYLLSKFALQIISFTGSY